MLATYSDLQNSILNFLGRPGDTIIPTDDLIVLFENAASRRLRTHWQETTSTITTVGGTASYDLPANFDEMREISITSLTPIAVLEYMTPPQLDDTWFDQNYDTQPVNYTIEESTLRFGPTPNAAYTVRLEYMANIGPLKTSPNWLYTQFPDCYLWGSLCEAELFLGADSSTDRYQIFLQRREQAFAEIRLADRKFKVGATPVRMRPDVWDVNPIW
jgi:hypothetical protein